MNDRHSLSRLQLERRTPRQAAALLAALGSTLPELEEGAALARRLGAVLVPECATPEDDSLEALESCLNAALAKYDLGVARLRAEDDALVVEIFEYPALNETPMRPELVTIGLLEGFLTAYLNGVSRIDRLAARLARPPESTANAIELVYRDHDGHAAEA